MKFGSIVGGGSVLVAAVFGANSGLIKESVNPAIKPVGLEAQDTHAAASLLGQFRTSGSAWLFLHADLYLHNGVEMRPRTDAEKARGKEAHEGSKSEEKIHDESNIVSVVPSSEEDFRGIMGDVERATASFKDMKNHRHNEPEDALPLYRLMTLLDPQFIQGWTTGANVMLWDKSPNGLKHALEFLNEGLTNNPKSIDILTTIAFCYLKERDGIRQFDKAIPYMERARQVVNENWVHLGEQEKDAALTNYRRLAVSLRETGHVTEQKQVVEEGLLRFPDDKAMEIYMRRLNGEIIPESVTTPPVVLKPKNPAAEDHDRDHDDQESKHVKIKFI